MKSYKYKILYILCVLCALLLVYVSTQTLFRSAGESPNVLLYIIEFFSVVILIVLGFILDINTAPDHSLSPINGVYVKCIADTIKA